MLREFVGVNCKSKHGCGTCWLSIICVRSVHDNSVSANMVKQRVLVTNPDVHQEAIDLLRERCVYAVVLYFNH